jgi:hypothetical protein
MLLDRFDQLLASFNRRRLDVPDGLLDKNAQFMLNGVSYEERLGRSADDPLLRLIARGTAGYRFAMTALLAALDPVRATRGPFTESSTGAVGVVMLSGRLRGSSDTFEQVVNVEADINETGTVVRLRASLPEDALARLREARAVN